MIDAEEGGRTTALLKAVSEGRADALDELVARHYAWVESRAKCELGPMVARRLGPEDIVQNVWLALIKSMPRIKVRTGDHFRALLTRMVVNSIRDAADAATAECRDLLRTFDLGPTTSLDLTGSGEAPDTVAANAEDRARLYVALKIMPLADARLIVLRDIDERPWAEIGITFGVTDDTARMRHEKAKSRLASTMASLRRGDIEAALDA